MNKPIKVTIVAGPGMGKSSVAFVLADMLRRQGIECSIGGAEDDAPGEMERTGMEHLKTLAELKQRVEIPESARSRPCSRFLAIDRL